MLPFKRACAQVITGQTQVLPYNSNTNPSYTYEIVGPYTRLTWSVDDGNIRSTGSSKIEGTETYTYYAVVDWYGPPNNVTFIKSSVRVLDKEDFFQNVSPLAVTIYSTTTQPNAPNAAFQFVYNCGSTQVSISNNVKPPDGTTWYWQTVSAGTSSSLGNSASISISNTNNLFLRARYTHPPFTWGAELNLGQINVFTNDIPAGSLSFSTSQCCLDYTLSDTQSGGVWSGNPYISSSGVFRPSSSGIGTFPLVYRYNSNGCSYIKTGSVAVTRNDCSLPLSLKADPAVIWVAGASTLRVEGSPGWDPKDYNFYWYLDNMLAASTGHIEYLPLGTITSSKQYEVYATERDDDCKKRIGHINVEVSQPPPPPSLDILEDNSNGDVVICEDGGSKIINVNSPDPSVDYSWAYVDKNNVTTQLEPEGDVFNFFSYKTSRTQLQLKFVNAINSPLKIVLTGSLTGGFGKVSQSKLFLVKVYSNPIQLNAIPAKIDVGATLDLSSKATPSGGNWSSSPVSSGINGSSFVPNSSMGGNNTLTYTYQNSDGCTFTKSQNIIVCLQYPFPFANDEILITPAIMCSPANVRISISDKDRTKERENNYSYKWVDVNGNTLPNSSPTFDAGYLSTSASFKVSAIDANGCVSTPVDINTPAITNLPAFTINVNDGLVCGGGSTTLSISNPQTSYTWSYNGVVLNSDKSSGNDSPDPDLPFSFLTSPTSITISNITGSLPSLSLSVSGQLFNSVCNLTQSASASPVVIFRNPMLDVGGDISLCKGSTGVNLVGSPANGTWSWTGTGVSSSGYFNPSDPALTASSVVLTYNFADDKNCTFSKNKNIILNPAPGLPPNQSTTICNWQKANLSIASIPSNAKLNWYNVAGGLVSTSNTFLLGPILQPGKQTFQIETEDVSTGCKSRSKATMEVTITEDCDDKLNWVETISYDENGSKIGQSKNYFDLLGQQIQSQTIDISKSKIFASQTIKDKFGRAVLNTLPVPIKSQSFRYNAGLALTTKQNQFPVFMAADFDEPATKSNPTPLNTTSEGTLGWYYSSNNSWEDHVPTTNFPYSRISLYEDGTGETKISAGPGDQHYLGSGNETLSGTFPVTNELDDYLAKRKSLLGITTPATTLSGAAVQQVVRDANGKYSVSITDKSGKTVMSARPSTTGSEKNCTAILSSQKRMHHFYLLNALNTVTIAGGTSGALPYRIEDIVSGQTVTPSGSWSPGFYRIIASPTDDKDTRTLTVTYKNTFTDISYQFYDDAGRLVSSISPKGVEQLATTAYASIDKTTYTYNHQGWLLSMTEIDAGTTSYYYRKDGKIRFSQNAEQKGVALSNGRFSYTNYDVLGRPIESGEFVLSNTFTFATVLSKVDDVDLSWMALAANGIKKDWVKTTYDIADTNFGTATGLTTLPPYSAQTFMRGAVSFTENSNNKTWYSYDELGRVTWMVQRPVALGVALSLSGGSIPGSGIGNPGGGGIPGGGNPNGGGPPGDPGAGNPTPTTILFTTEYSYDFLGNVTMVCNKTFQKGSTGSPTLLTSFYHHYTYDGNKRLLTASTSLDGSSLTLQASYSYYLHGPLKRIELATNLQGIDFVYNINGWLQSINDPSADPGGDGGSGSTFKKDVFGMVLDYYQSTFGSVKLSSVAPTDFHGLPQFAKASNAPQNPREGQEDNEANLPFFKQVLLKNLEQLKVQLQEESGSGQFKDKGARKVGLVSPNEKNSLGTNKP